jgi:16S rRNA G966 N2-methylase RsmD
VCYFCAAEFFLKRAKTPFDIIFCDPPFPYRFREEILKTIAQKNLLTAGGIFILHRPREAPLSGDAGILRKTDSREYGRSIVDFYTSGASGA